MGPRIVPENERTFKHLRATRVVGDLALGRCGNSDRRLVGSRRGGALGLGELAAQIGSLGSQEPCMKGSAGCGALTVKAVKLGTRRSGGFGLSGAHLGAEVREVGDDLVHVAGDAFLRVVDSGVEIVQPLGEAGHGGRRRSGKVWRGRRFVGEVLAQAILLGLGERLTGGDAAVTALLAVEEGKFAIEQKSPCHPCHAERSEASRCASSSPGRFAPLSVTGRVLRYCDYRVRGQELEIRSSEAN